MAFTQSQLDALDAAIATGALEVRFADRSVRYNSIADMMKARTFVALELMRQNGQTPIRQVRFYSDKGYSD